MVCKTFPTINRSIILVSSLLLFAVLKMQKKEYGLFWKSESQGGRKSSRILYSTLIASNIPLYSCPVRDVFWCAGAREISDFGSRIDTGNCRLETIICSPQSAFRIRNSAIWLLHNSTSPVPLSPPPHLVFFLHFAF